MPRGRKKRETKPMKEEEVVIQIEDGEKGQEIKIEPTHEKKEYGKLTDKEKVLAWELMRLMTIYGKEEFINVLTLMGFIS